jgi:mono/diheme cytochrome c family protein
MIVGRCGVRPLLTVGLLGALVNVSGAGDSAPQFPEGATNFQQNCAVCHGAAGGGLPSLAPPLTSYPAHYAASPEGRRQLAMTVLYGLFGEIAVEDKRFDFKMPDFARLDDATLAATLNFVVFDLAHAPATVTSLSAADIAAERAHPVDGAAVREHRKTVVPAAP